MPKGVYKRKSWEERFWGKINKLPGEDSCWEWTSAICDGYGVIWMMKEKGYASYRAHRLSWEVHFGEIPNGLEVCHKCDNRKCVRPDHLWLGTQKQNMHDMIQKGRWRGGNLPPSDRKGSEVPSSKLNEEKVFRIKRLFLKGVTPYRISQWIGMTHQAIIRIKNGKNWKHVPDPRNERDTYEEAAACAH